MIKLFKNFSIFILGLLVFIFNLIAPSLLAWYYWLVLVVAILILFDLLWISNLKVFSIAFWSHAIGPVLFFISASLFYTLLSIGWWSNIFWLIVSLVLVVYLYNIWLFYGRPEKYQAFTLENYSWYLNIVISFLSASSLFGFIIFINFSLSLSLLIVFLLSGLLFYQMWWIQKIDQKKFWFYFILAVIIGLEIFITLFYLPFSFYILAFWWASFWYVTERIVLAAATNTLVAKKIVRLSVFILLINIILTATTRWF